MSTLDSKPVVKLGPPRNVSPFIRVWIIEITTNGK